MTAARVIIIAALVSLLLWEVHILVQRWVLAVLVVLMIVLSGG